MDRLQQIHFKKDLRTLGPTRDQESTRDAVACKTTSHRLSHTSGATLPTTLPTFQKLNLKLLSSKEAGHWCGRGARGSKTAAGKSTARHTHTLCVHVRELGPEDHGLEQTTTAFPHGIHSLLVAFRRILRRTAWSPWRSGREANPQCRPTPQPPPNQISETGLFSPDLLPSPALLCSHVCGGSY